MIVFTKIQRREDLRKLNTKIIQSDSEEWACANCHPSSSVGFRFRWRAIKL